MEMQNFEVSELQNPWTDWQKTGVGDYVGDDSPHAKTENDHPTEGVAAYARNITIAWFSYLFLWPQILLASRD